MFHLAVLVNEVIEGLQIGSGIRVIDGTVGSGGHALEMARLIGKGGKLLAMDRDPRMLAIAETRLRAEFAGQAGPEMHFTARPYEKVAEAMAEVGFGEGADAILLDLGVNSLQIDDAARGFSFSKDGPLDGRFNPEEQGPTMADLVNSASERDLSRWLHEYADEHLSRRIARRIVERRAAQPFTTTGQLADLVCGVYPPDQRHGRIHPATRTFQALRIAANDEMGAVERGLKACMEALAPGGRLAVLTFHSIEDRICKRLFRDAAEPRPDPSNPYSATSSEGLRFELPRRDVVTCSEEESARNPRARSAKLRVIRKREVPT